MAAGHPMLSGIVLAGGAGRRMGRPKGPVVVGGVAMAQAAADLLRMHCDEVIVVGRRGIPLPPLDVPVYMDRPGPDAPLTGMATGLGATACDDVIVLACDLPFAAPVVATLAAMPVGTAAVACAHGRPQPLCARYPRVPALAVADALLAAGRLPAMGLVRALAAARVTVPDDVLLNLNTQDDLRAARRRWAAVMA